MKNLFHTVLTGTVALLTGFICCFLFLSVLPVGPAEFSEDQAQEITLDKYCQDALDYPFQSIADHPSEYQHWLDIPGGVHMFADTPVEQFAPDLENSNPQAETPSP